MDQILNLLFYFVWSVGLVYIIYQVINSLIKLRWSFNPSEKSSQSIISAGKVEILNLLSDIERQGLKTNFPDQSFLDPKSELGQIALRYNKVLEDLVIVTKEKEKALEELTSRNSIIKLLLDVAAGVNSALTPEEALSLAINHICTELKWSIGHVFVVSDTDKTVLKSSKLWYLKDPLHFAEFMATSEETYYLKGQGLPGKAYQEREIFWSNKLISASNLIRENQIKKLGLQSSIALPINAYENVVAVLEFFSENKIIVDQQTLEVLEQITIQVSRVIERCLVHENLMENEEKIRLIVETSLDAVIMMDDTGSITVWNRQAEQIFGWNRGEVINRQLSEIIIPAKYREAHNNGITNYLIDKKGVLLNKRVEATGLHRDGHEFPIELAITPIKSGKRQLFSAFIRDISDRKQAENELIRAKESAEEATRSKSTFLANISHEIRTPMNGILGMTELLLDTKLEQEQKEYLITVKNCTESLLVIIDDVLDFSKIEAGRIELELIPFNLRDRISHLVSLLEERGRQKELEFVFNIAPDIPLEIMGDPYRLGQVIINLVGNAIKFTPPHGAIVLHVSVETSNSEEAFLHFAVTDSGIGIPEDKQQLIFAPFAQADVTTTREYGGTGLGLAISSRLVELLGGRLWVKSTPGVGTVFHFTARFKLPKERSEESRPPSYQDSDLESGKSTIPIRQKNILNTKFDHKVLLVEDNLVNKKVAAILLEKLGLQVVTAENGEEALDILAQDQDFDLVLMDCQMPVMDGYTAAIAIRESEKITGKHLPIIALTAHAMDGDREKCLNAGMDDYVSKPIKTNLLIEVLRRFL